MKTSTVKISTMVLAAVATLAMAVAHARDTRLKLPIQDAMSSADAQARLGTEVKFVFGSTPAGAKGIGTYVSNKKTNFANKSDKEGCEWAFLSAMLALKERALAQGGNAVVNIQSYYKKNEFTSATEYECAAGAFVGGVALRGTVAKL